LLSEVLFSKSLPTSKYFKKNINSFLTFPFWI